MADGDSGKWTIGGLLQATKSAATVRAMEAETEGLSVKAQHLHDMIMEGQRALAIEREDLETATRASHERQAEIESRLQEQRTQFCAICSELGIEARPVA